MCPVDVFLRRGAFPTALVFDKALFNLGPPGGSLSISKYESPPLNPGRYFIEVTNTGALAGVSVNISKVLGLDLAGVKPVTFLSPGDELIPDDAVMYSTNHVGLVSKVVAAEVGVRIDHPRISDLVLTLISPAGTRVLLAENRGRFEHQRARVGREHQCLVRAQTAGGFAANTQDITAVRS